MHLGAPGVDIYSCFNSFGLGLRQLRRAPAWPPRTSVGAAALVLARYPNATLTELRRRILNGAVPIPSLTDKTVTGGRLNAYNSLAAAPSRHLAGGSFAASGQHSPPAGPSPCTPSSPTFCR